MGGHWMSSEVEGQKQKYLRRRKFEGEQKHQQIKKKKKKSN